MARFTWFLPIGLLLATACAGQTAPAVEGHASAPDDAPTAAGSAAADSADVALGVHTPLATTGRQLSVQLRLNGTGPYLFTVDTGSGMAVCIDEELARTLELPTVGEVLNSDSSDRVVTRPLVGIDALEFGGHDFGAQRALVADYRFVSGTGNERVMGILGLPLFASGVVTLDAPGETLRWSAGALKPGGNVVPYITPRGIPEIDVTLGGRAVHATVDTGFVGELSLPDTLRDAVAALSEPVLVGQARGPNGVGAEVWGLEVADELVFAGQRVATPTVWFSAGRDTAYLGGALLRRYVLRFDLRQQLLGVSLPGD